MTLRASPRIAALLFVAAIGSFACSKSSSSAQSTSNELANPPQLPAPPTRNEQTTLEARPEAQGRAAVALPSFKPLVDSVKAAVINVEVRSTGPAQPGMTRGDPWQDFFDRFFGRPRGRGPPRGQIRAGLGSGFIISQTGIALTNNHVIEGAISINVRLNDGRGFDAEVLGRDPLTDVGLIKFNGSPHDLPVVPLGDSDALQVGDWVVAIGNPFGLTSSVSAGIISAKDRNIGAGPYDDFLQTDAAINPGNSGGPLFNLRGEVIGINTAIVGGGTGIGFAVPSNVAKALLPHLEKEGHVTRGWLGVTAQTLTPDLAKAMGAPAREGAVVADFVSAGTPAEKAGLKPDDVIVALDGQPVASSNTLTRMVALKPPGTTVAVTVLRGGKKEEVKVTLGKRPDIEGVEGEVGSGGSATAEQRQAKIGLVLEDVNPSLARSQGVATDRGALITEVAPGSLAENAGLATGMVIIEADGRPIRRSQDFIQVIRQAKPGSLILLRVVTPEGKLLNTLRVPN